MKLVIEIPEEVRNRLGFGITYKNDLQILAEALNEGITLPKGHGRLIDADNYLAKECPRGISEDTWKESHVYKSISNALTIVEADRRKKQNDSACD